MKRNMDLYRQLLLAIEECDAPALRQVPTFEGHDERTVIEHVRLGIEAGHITAVDASTLSGCDYIMLRMAWAGHEFLENVRDPEIWESAKAGAARVGTFSLGLLGELAIGYAKAKAQALGLPMM